MKTYPLKNGFTLIEALVVLVISSFTVGVLMTAYYQIMRVQQRFGVERAYAEQGSMVADWLRQIIQGVHPDYDNGDAIFSGEEVRLTGQTSNPLTANFGSSEAFVLRIAYNQYTNRSEVRYQPLPGGAETVLIEWSGHSGRFQYFDDKGVPHSSWPPAFDVAAQVPRAISVQMMREHAPWVIVAAPRASPETPVRLRDFASGNPIF